MARKLKNKGEEIKIPNDYMERIDRIVNKGLSVYPSRDDFIKNAIEIKIAELRKACPK